MGRTKNTDFPLLLKLELVTQFLPMRHKLRVPGKRFANQIQELPLSLPSFHVPPAWNVDVRLEEQQPRWDDGATSLRTKAAVLRVVGQKDGCRSSP